MCGCEAGERQWPIRWRPSRGGGQGLFAGGLPLLRKPPGKLPRLLRIPWRLHGARVRAGRPHFRSAPGRADRVGTARSDQQGCSGTGCLSGRRGESCLRCATCMRATATAKPFHYEVKLVDVYGQAVGLGIEGEICARGPALFLGYARARVSQPRAHQVGRCGEKRQGAA